MNELVERIDTAIDEHGWAAGCIWDEDSEPATTLEAGYLAGVDREVDLASDLWGSISDGVGISTVYLPNSTFEAALPLVSNEGDGYFCLRPANLP